MDFTSGSSGRTPSRSSRPEMPQRSAEAPQRVSEAPRYEPQPPHHPSHSPQKHTSRKKAPLIIGIIVLLALLAAAGWWLMRGNDNGAIGIDSNKYQAVFFSNGQVYFGKLHQTKGDYLTLTDVFYLQTEASKNDTASKNPQATTDDQGNVQLIKLGNEVHGPEDKMVISKEQILFYENLKSDGKVAQTIEQYKK